MRHAGTVIAKAAHRPDRQGQADRRAGARTRRRTSVEFKDGRFSSPTSNRSFDFLELAKEAAQLKLPRN